MRKSFILSVICTLAGLCSCQPKIGDDVLNAYSPNESEVEVSIVTRTTTHNVISAVPDENSIDNLDVLLFDSNGKFVCWRTTFKVNGKLRTTLPIGKNYDAYFLANCRSFIEKMLPNEAAEAQYKQNADWEVFLKKLIDITPQRLLQENASFTSLPMWGILKNQEVNDRVINYWPLLSLTRSVASVDVYVAAGIDNFTLRDVTLYNVPDKGFLGNLPANIVDSQAQEAVSPEDMQTSLTLESNDYDAANRSIANKLYLYDNDTESETAGKKHTRLVIGAEYKGAKYYYPIDFEDADTDKLIKIIRNKKYVFNINSADGPGYTDKEIAATQPSIHLNVNVVEWDMAEGQIGVSGNYYLWTEKREAILYRKTNSTTTIGMKSNILSEAVTLAFKTDVNGATATFTDGIRNNRFEVELTNDADGYPTGLKVTALGDYDKDSASANSDTVVILSGRIRLEIQISLYSQGKNDWELDDDIDVDLDK